MDLKDEKDLKDVKDIKDFFGPLCFILYACFRERARAHVKKAGPVA